MEEIKKFKNLHGEILILFDKISLLLHAEKITKNTVTIRSLLSSLKVYLKTLFFIQEKTLFPILLNEGDETIKSKANCFIPDIGEIKDIYYKNNEKWARVGLIQKDPDNFIKETRIIFDKFFGVFIKEKEFIRLTSEVEEQNNNVYT